MVDNPHGQVLEKTTRTRIISEPATPDYWTYLETLDHKLPDADHILYLYLVKDNVRCIPYGQFTSHFPLPDGRQIPIDDREAFEQAIQARYGGGQWRLILKCGKQRRTEAKIYTGDGPTLPPPEPNTPPPGSPPYSPYLATQAFPGANPNNPFLRNFGQPAPTRDANIELAAHAIDTISGQENKQVNIATDLLTSAVNTMKSAVEMRLASANAPTNELQAALTNAMIARLTQDPLAQMAQFLTLMREMHNGNGNGNGNDLDRIRGVAGLIREFSSNAVPAVSAGAEIVRSVANVIPGAIDGVRAASENWRAGKEAEAAAILAQTQPAAPVSARPIGNPLFTSPPPPARPVPVPSPSSLPPAASAGAGAPSTEFIETRIMELLRQPISADEAAEHMLTFLHTLAGDNPPSERDYVQQLVSLGETGLVNLFHMRATLKPATANMGRLLEFIRAFLKYHAEDQAEDAKESKPN